MRWEKDDIEHKTFEAGGTYEATVVEAEERMSQAGNPLINLRLDVSGTTMFTNVMPKWPAKLAHFCRSAGLEDKWELMSLEARDCVGKKVLVVLSEEKNERGYYDVEDFTWPGRDDNPKPEKVSGGVPTGQSKKARVLAKPEDDVPF